MAEKKISLSLISDYRTPLMGIAMLMVVFSHLPIPTNQHLFKFFQWNGHFGVDIFLLLSGMGLFFSFSKDSDLRVFYLKRVIRIFPFYFFINLVYILTPGYIHVNSIWEVLATITTIGYWLDYGYCDWFIPHLVLMYLTFPLFYKLINKFNRWIVVFIMGCVWFLLYLLPFSYDLFYRASYRWIVFALGVLLGKTIWEQDANDSYKRISLYLLGGGILLSIFFFLRYSDFNLSVRDQLLYQRGYIYMPYLLSVIGFCLITGYVLERIKSMGVRNVLVWGGQILGSMSLELYLVHCWLIQWSYILYKSLGIPLYLVALIIFLSFPISYCFHYINAAVTKRLSLCLLSKLRT